MPGRDLDQSACTHAAEPARVEVHARALTIEDAEDLLLVGTRIGLHFLDGKAWSGRIATGRVTDQSGEVADQEDHFVAKLLERTHLVDQHGMPEVQIRRGRIEAGFDAQGRTALQFAFELRGQQQLMRAARDLGHLFLQTIVHGAL